MKKPQKKKLQVDVQLIRVLTPEQLTAAAGGMHAPCSQRASGCGAGPE